MDMLKIKTGSAKFNACFIENQCVRTQIKKWTLNGTLEEYHSRGADLFLSPWKEGIFIDNIHN